VDETGSKSPSFGIGSVIRELIALWSSFCISYPNWNKTIMCKIPNAL
jgi:hypothetical protein